MKDGLNIMAITYQNELTAREREEMDFTREENEKNRNFELEKARLTNELAKIEQRWNQLFRIPLVILILPIKLVVSFWLPLAIFAKNDALQDLLKFLKS